MKIKPYVSRVGKYWIVLDSKGMDRFASRDFFVAQDWWLKNFDELAK